MLIINTNTLKMNGKRERAGGLQEVESTIKIGTDIPVDDFF